MTTQRIKVFLKKKSLLNIFYNNLLIIQSFILIINNKRVWGIDRDNRIGWHEHSIVNPENHILIEEQTIAQIIQKLKKNWRKFD